MRIESGRWSEVLASAFEKESYKTMWQNLELAYEETRVYPPKSEVFSAFELTDYDQVKVVILGQDPYHGPGQAHGLSFSVKPGVKIPPSLKNIYKELLSDVGVATPDHGYLVEWAQQGVLMLNAFLTVREKAPSSHSKIGWGEFTDHVISVLNDRKAPVIFVLWGNFAITKEVLITNPWHYVIKSPHPSPFSARKGFFASKPFSRINEILSAEGTSVIDWRISQRQNEDQQILDIF